MKIEKIKFKSRTKNFYAEAIPDNSGVRFMQYDEYGEECVAMFVDNGEEFFLTSKNRYGMLVRPFKPTIQLLLKDGTEPPLEGENQIEVYTPYNKKMIVRTLEKENRDRGVVVAYEDDDKLWSIALVGAPIDGILISLSK